jgi:hypothetical protein
MVPHDYKRCDSPIRRNMRLGRKRHEIIRAPRIRSARPGNVGGVSGALGRWRDYWKLFRVSPEAGTWTAIFECPAGSSFHSHVHTGPGEYFLYKGKMEVRGGDEEGGTTATAPAYGFEPSGARHDRTFFVEDSAFYMTFSGPIAFINPDGTIIANIGWSEVQGAWEAQLQS